MTGRSRLLAAVLVLSVLAFASLIAYANHLSRQRDAAIQRSRVESCERTYQSFPLMFQPFFPADRADWTARQLRDWEKLGARADELARQCVKQTTPKGG